jgi:TOMM system kinase/cyclase fusion protein
MEDRALAAHYEILSALGSGSFGTVYQARQISTGQLVAVKILHPGPAFDASKTHRIARFRREMSICARLHHPNIVRFIDSGVNESGEPYAVFAFLPGKTLDQVLAEHGPLEPVEARHLMLQVLDGLACAHAQGVVHRDIKPSNVMVVASGGRPNAVILDFGIGSYRQPNEPRLTASGDWLGSASYSAPEQIGGSDPSPRSDLYSWGLMFVECLTGEPVMRGFTVATTLWQHLSTDSVPVPPEIRESALGRLLDRVLVKDVEHRTVTAPELLRALEACNLDDLPPRARRAPTETAAEGVPGDAATRNALAGSASDATAVEPREARPRGSAAVDREKPVRQADSRPRERPRMVGRHNELALLRERWQATREGEGHVVLISGDAGIGKSRLLAELELGIQSEPHHRLICRCTPESQTSALAPLVDMLEGLLRSSAESEQSLDASARAAALAALVARLGLPLDEIYPVFADLLTLPADERYPLPQVSPQRHKEHTLNALVSLLGELAERQPLLFIVEDLHWADATTHELVAALVREPPRRMLGVWSARPELTATWTAGALTQIRLGSLSRDDSGALAVALAGARGMADGALHALVERCDGVPLFIEEMAYMMCEADDGAAALADASQPAIPSTLRGLLDARLDRLGRARETAQVAAAIGREFEAELVLAASTLDGDAVRDDLDRLVATGLVHRRRRSSRSASYQFKHALVRDAVYDSCAEPQREVIHGRVARALEARFPDVVQTRPDLLAHHHAAAQQRREAIDYAARAARLALQLSANAQAAIHARRAIGWLGAFTDERERAQHELSLNALLIPALLATQGWVGPEIKEAIERSRSLLVHHGDDPHAIPAQWALLIYHHTRGQRREARGVAEQILATAAASGDQNQEVATLPAYGACLGVDGRLAEARAACERVLALYDPALHAGHAVVYGFDSKAFAGMTLAFVLWLQGHAAQAVTQVDEAVAWARRVDHASSTALALFYIVMIAQQRGDRDTVLRVSQEILEMDARHGLPAQAAYAAMMHSWAVRDLPRLRGALDYMQAAGLGLGLSAYRSLIADLLMETGDFAGALAELEAIWPLARETEEGYWLPDILRLRGACLRRVHPDAPADAERCFAQALEIAQGQGSMLHTLRAAAAKARLFADTGRRDEARALLAPVLDWFDAGHEADRLDWPDLLAARQLCASLS